MNLDAFCAGLGDTVIERVQEFNARRKLPGDAVVVGCGRSLDPAALPPTMLLLDNKGSQRRFGLEHDYASVSRLVADPPAGFFEAWPLSREPPLPLPALLGRLTFVVEDASPDSAWGVLLLLARLSGVEPGEIPTAWLDAVERWEVEGMVEDAYGEWPSLASALGHSRFPVGGQPSDGDFARALTDVLRFAAGCLGRGFDPAAIPRSPGWELWRRAETALRQEEQTYHDWLPHAFTVQLSLPLATASRRLLLDALLFAEDQPTGAAKIFYRNDQKNAPLGQGFALAAHYRPDRSDGSTDITVSLDPRAGLQLGDLWEELERRECAAWAQAGETRPDWAPRRLEGQANSWNQPWYMDPARTLIASPYNVADERSGGRPDIQGSRLSWEAVKEAIWAVYDPLTGILVCAPGDDRPQALLDLAAVAIGGGGKRLLLADWPRGPLLPRNAVSRSLGAAPVVERVIAALIDRDDPSRAVTIDTLTAPGTWQRVELGGGFAIVTGNGVFVLDDWRETPRLDLDQIRACCIRAGRLDHQLSELETGRVKPLAARLQNWLGARARLTEPRGLVREIAETVVQLAELRSNAIEVPGDADVRRVWEALDRQWALERRLGTLEQQTRIIGDAIKSVGDARVRRMTRFAARFGLPYGFSTALAGPVARWVASGYGLGDQRGLPPAWLWAACFAALLVGFLGLGSLLLRLDTPRGARQDRADRRGRRK